MFRTNIIPKKKNSLETSRENPIIFSPPIYLNDLVETMIVFPRLSNAESLYNSTMEAGQVCPHRVCLRDVYPWG